MNSLQTEESGKEIHPHLNYLLLLWRKVFEKADILWRNQFRMKKTLQI